MLERKPWKRPRKGKKIPREKTDRDQSEPLLLFSSFQLQWTPATQNLPGSLWPQGRLPGEGPAAGGAGGPKGPPNSTPLLRRHPTRDEPGTRALHLHGLTDTSWRVKPTHGTHTARAHGARDIGDPHGKFFTTNIEASLARARNLVDSSNHIGFQSYMYRNS